MALITIMARLFSASGLLFVVTTSHFIGAWAELYPIQLKTDTVANTQLVFQDQTCFISFVSGTWECTQAGKSNRGLVVKQTGELVMFTNRLTGWWKKRKAAHVIYPGQGVKMVKEGKRVVFKDLTTHNEAVFDRQETAAIAAAEVKINFDRRDYVESDRKKISDGWYRLSFDGTYWSFETRWGSIANWEGSCKNGLALVSNGRGQLEWKVFGRRSGGTKRKAVAGICLGPDVTMTKQDGVVLFTYPQPERGIPRKVRLESGTVDIGFYYIPYRPNAKGDLQPGFVKAPAGTPCRLVYYSTEWRCEPMVKRRGHPKGLLLKLESGNRQKGVFTYSGRSFFGSKDYAALIVPGRGVTLSRSPEGCVTFTDRSSGESAAFILGEANGLLPARDEDEPAVAFAKRAIDEETAVTLRINPTDPNGARQDLIVDSPTGVISYEGGEWKYTAGPRSYTKEGGLAIEQSISAPHAATVSRFNGDRPVGAIAVVYPADSVTMMWRGDHIVLNDRMADVRGRIPTTLARQLPPSYGYTGVEVPFTMGATNYKAANFQNTASLRLVPSPVIGSVKVCEVSLVNGRWNVNCSPGSLDWTDQHPFLTLQASAGQFTDQASMLLTVSNDSSIPLDTVAVIKAGPDVVAEYSGKGIISFRAIYEHRGSVIFHTTQIAYPQFAAVKLTPG